LFSLDYRPLRYDTTLWNDHYSVSNEVSVPFDVFLTPFIHYLYACPDTSVLVNNGAADLTVWTYADARIPTVYVGLELIKVLVIISTHHQNPIESRAMLDSAANADDRIFQGCAV